MFHLANNCILRDEEYIKIVKDCIDEVIGQYKTEDNENKFDIKCTEKLLTTITLPLLETFIHC
jgi:hypothetical protein